MPRLHPGLMKGFPKNPEKLARATSKIYPPARTGLDNKTNNYFTKKLQNF